MLIILISNVHLNQSNTAKNGMHGAAGITELDEIFLFLIERETELFHLR